MSQHIPRKRFGQNFLIDQGIIGDIIYAINPRHDDLMVEIGPGLGALTQPLLAQLKHLHCVEIDRDIISRLQKQHPADRLTIHGIDALKFDFGELGERLRIVGNLPYNISSPLLFHLAEYNDRILDMHFMLQKEVVDRMVAEPSTTDYGRLSVMLQYRFYMEKVLDVPPQAFNPPPKVDSAIVRMIPLPKPELACECIDQLEKVVSQAFSQRRKTLRNNLKEWLDISDFEQLDMDPGLRPENLSVTDFVRMTNLLSSKPGNPLA
ncbi:16S rRNA (adenine1518-N6/adenine1519-N6)-dimethyltransferase [Chitinivorax tropicus]|uniref:Ribosomal RNA small subunit methyltransferase A n=1 Tax=Chitinivorax tropicus TaxID=714531 RepID=A0A840MPW7_9PROT|nr:16S rRNA (adenine(1518)-N(6)/adenine(1519)-N(6))-dimethyltransferase RsmA [Chitinivorax tropicus]MBB5017291.1 16S rRNA (adenine1518-N6/adenine1519-N6)-dimethyltransferase [Chitinivorax tropicus]